MGMGEEEQPESTEKGSDGEVGVGASGGSGLQFMLNYFSSYKIHFQSHLISF